MRAVNLIPSDSRRGQRAGIGLAEAPSYVALALLAAALGLVTIYVLSGNKVADRQAQLASVKAQVAQEQAVAARMGSYAQFTQTAQKRIQTVQQIAAARFDWYDALSGLSRVISSGTTLQSLTGTVVPGASAGQGSATGGGLRGDISAPAFELSGCETSQNQVAQLMSRLRLINGVTRVSLSQSEKAQATGSSGTTSSQGCPSSDPVFDIVVFFQPVANAGATGVTSVSASTSSTAGTS